MTTSHSEDLFGKLETPDRQTWKISAKWLIKPHDCTLQGILDKCGGSCCTTNKYKNIWPPRSGSDGVCPMLGPQGCELGDDRPVTCHLYPLRLNSNGTLVKHSRANLAAGICAGCANSGPPLIEAMRGSLEVLFGKTQYKAMRESILAGVDYSVRVPDWIHADLKKEEVLEADNLFPEKNTRPSNED